MRARHLAVLAATWLHCPLKRGGTDFMKIIGAVVLASLVLLPVHWQPGMTATNDPKTGKVVDASGNCGCPAIIAPHTSLWAAGRWRSTKARVLRRSTSSMHRPTRSVRTVKTGILWTALCL